MIVVKKYFQQWGVKGGPFFQENFYDAIKVDVQQLEKCLHLFYYYFLPWVRNDFIMQFLFMKIVNLNLIKFITDIHNTFETTKHMKRAGVWPFSWNKPFLSICEYSGRFDAWDH